ncbi:GGDEF domain-containing protein [Aliikangiella coralliicola]|uniref:diguanylate cyclase n=1 Tax=Aliikangiella coralliicola TaxID=2592383 RepID=A0A545UBL8_9GAMM|nr:GGDEF domain-containing protein [Aliikangiella coralliicola]TQV86859.1 GGDEF domain-containing protein [Aliikangiella coralliicola]
MDLQRKIIQIIPKPYLVLLISTFSMIMALALDVVLVWILNYDYRTEDLIGAIVLPFLVAPVISWYTLEILYEVDRLEVEKKKAATYDSLTGLLNRRAFIQSCNSIFELAKRNKQHCCLIAIDIDFFKKINDTFGHQAGDNVLAEFGNIAKTHAKTCDLAGRLGGEEFAFFLPKTSLQQAKILAEKLLSAAKTAEIIYDNAKIQLTISIGIATTNGQSHTLQNLLKNADQALYHAKHSGRDQLSVFQPVS